MDKLKIKKFMRYLIIFMVFISCKNDVIEQNNNLGKEWINNFRDEGGELFYEFDYYSLSGKKKYKLNNSYHGSRF